MRICNLLLCLISVISFCTTSANAALSEQEINTKRTELKNNVTKSTLGSGYAHIITFFIQPDVSASTYNVHDEYNTQFDIYKIPLQKTFRLNTDGWEIALRGVVGYATLEDSMTIISDTSVDSKWKAYSGSIGTGIIIPVINDLKWLAAVDLGVSHMRNSSSYSGSYTDAVSTLFDGILYNWDTDVWVGSFVLGLNYNHQFVGEYNLDIEGRYTYSNVSSFNESKDFTSFNESAQTITLAADFTHPFGFSVATYPLYGVAHLGNTSFVGEDRGSLGFDSFFDFGYSVKIDIMNMGTFVDSLRIGYQFSVGDNVEGHTILFGWDVAVF